MHTPFTINFDELPWQAHPTIAGIETKFFQNEAAFAPRDVLVATVTENGEIPWHVHATDSELAYVLQGSGTLSYAPDESHEPSFEIALHAGAAIVVPPTVWHRVLNMGAEDLLIFAIHMSSEKNLNSDNDSTT